MCKSTLKGTKWQVKIKLLYWEGELAKIKFTNVVFISLKIWK